MAVSTEGAVMPAWSHDGKEFFFFSPDDHLASATVELTCAICFEPLGGVVELGLRVPPDGQSFLVDTVINSAFAEPISLVENWDSPLGNK
jgi:hypothetical protein